MNENVIMTEWQRLSGIENNLNEDYGKEGKFELPENHKPFTDVPNGGSCCANCRFFVKDGNICKNKYFIQWNGSEKIDGDPNSHCSDWWESK